MTVEPKEGAKFYMLHTGLRTRYREIGNKYQQKSKVKNQQQEKRKRVFRQQEKPSNKRKEMSSPATRKNPEARKKELGSPATRRQLASAIIASSTGLRWLTYRQVI